MNNNLLLTKIKKDMKLYCSKFEHNDGLRNLSNILNDLYDEIYDDTKDKKQIEEKKKNTEYIKTIKEDVGYENSSHIYSITDVKYINDNIKISCMIESWNIRVFNDKEDITGEYRSGDGCEKFVEF